jgi:hypothetical protein
LNNQNTKKIEKQAKTLQCYSSEPVYSPQDKLLQRKFLSQTKKKRGKTPNKAVFSPQHFTVIKKWGPCCSTKKGQSSKNNFDNNAKTILEKLIAFDFNEQTQRTVKDQNIWRQFLQSPQTLQWAHLGRAS